MEQTCTNEKNFAGSSFVHDPWKRKKVEMTEIGGASADRLELEWHQTEEEVSLQVRNDAISKHGNIEQVEVSFTERQMVISLPDGQQQSWTFHAAIDETKSRVVRAKKRFKIGVFKKQPALWPALEASLVENTASEAGEQHQEEEQTENRDSVSPSTELPDTLHEVRTKEEEPVLNLQHIKHDFFEKDDILTIHIYVKNISKDAVKIHFDKQSFTVKFQTGDAKFLQLHEGSSEETVFCWTVNTRNAIVPSGCKMKTTGSNMELKLKKASTERWATLEAPVKKEASSTTPKSRSWVPLNQSASTAGGSGAGSSHVAFDEMAQMDDNRSVSGDLPASSTLSSTATKTQKPTAKVHPLTTQPTVQAEKRRGFTGLANLGNTCYMNSVIQVLANTPEIRDYFLGGQFQYDINRKSGGELAVCFAVLLKTLWNGSHQWTSPSKLKELISRKVSQFQGYQQHDAQEFLSYLLDGLHEDVNRVQKKAITPPIEDNSSKPDHVIAHETWTSYKKREDSYLVDLMYGQYKHKITCLNCNEVSSSFDPFSILPLPLPKNKKILTVVFMWRDPQRKPIKYQIQMVRDSTVEHLIELLSHKTGVRPKNMRVFEVYRSLFYRRFVPSCDLSKVANKDLIIASEVLSADDAGEEVVELQVIQRMLVARHPVTCASCRTECDSDTKLKRCTKCLKVGYCNQACQRNHWLNHKNQCSPGPEPVGCPFYLSLPRSHCTYSRIARLMESFARYSVDTFQPPVKPDTTTTSTITTTSSSAATTTTTTTTMPPPPTPDLSLPSHPSASNLSSSSGSQSSGSLSSLDSISSCSSTATLTADTTHATFNVGQSGDEDDDVEKRDVDELGGGDVDSGLGSVSSCQSGAPSQASGFGTSQGDCKREDGTEKDKNTERSSASVQSVAASMSGDRSIPLFFIKPVDMDGRGRREMERLEDKGERVLDVGPSPVQLSMDWRNSEKLPSYVLVQSKQLECEEDDSVRNPSFLSDTLTLQQCLEHYHAPEILCDKNAWTCEKCKRKQEAVKQCSLWKVPHIFIVQLKRFSSYGYYMRKIETKVDFPVVGLNLTPFKTDHQPGDPDDIYDLFGVINHHGFSAIGGHYTCRARCADPGVALQNEVGWRLFDDIHVSPMRSEKSVVDSNAYVLFYRRRERFVPPPVVPPIAAAEEEPKTQTVTVKKEKVLLGDVSNEQLAKDNSSNLFEDGQSDERKHEAEDTQDEKRDLEKEEDESEELSGSEGRLEIDTDSNPSVHLDYTDINAVD